MFLNFLDEDDNVMWDFVMKEHPFVCNVGYHTNDSFSWILMKSLAHSLSWSSKFFSRPKQALLGKSKIKSMLICFLTEVESPPKNVFLQDKLWNRFYKGDLPMTPKRVIRVIHDIADKWILHHDNDPMSHCHLCHRFFDL